MVCATELLLWCVRRSSSCVRYCELLVCLVLVATQRCYRTPYHYMTCVSHHCRSNSCGECGGAAPSHMKHRCAPSSLSFLHHCRSNSCGACDGAHLPLGRPHGTCKGFAETEQLCHTSDTSDSTRETQIWDDGHRCCVTIVVVWFKMQVHVVHDVGVQPQKKRRGSILREPMPATGSADVGTEAGPWD